MGKGTKGITLLGLVVTIIVLIILAGISINLTLGENGIITKARETQLAQEIAEIKEKLGLDILDAQMEAIERNESLEQSQLEDIISNYGQLQDDKNTIILNDGKGSITLTDIYTGMTTTTGSYTENKAELVEFRTKIASAITNMGVTTSENASADTMASNIRSIPRTSAVEAVSHTITATASNGTSGSATLNVAKDGRNIVGYGIHKVKSSGTANMMGASQTVNVSLNGTTLNVYVNPAQWSNSTYTYTIDVIVYYI